jgi:rubrerythrin
VIRRQAEAAEVESRRFYERAAARTTDPPTRQLLDDLAQAERTHEVRADALPAQRHARETAGTAFVSDSAMRVRETKAGLRWRMANGEWTASHQPF